MKKALKKPRDEGLDVLIISSNLGELLKDECLERGLTAESIVHNEAADSFKIRKPRMVVIFNYCKVGEDGIEEVGNKTLAKLLELNGKLKRITVGRGSEEGNQNHFKIPFPFSNLATRVFEVIGKKEIYSSKRKTEDE